jgi:hypothetical protein
METGAERDLGGKLTAVAKRVLPLPFSPIISAAQSPSKPQILKVREAAVH